MFIAVPNNESDQQEVILHLFTYYLTVDLKGLFSHN